MQKSARFAKIVSGFAETIDAGERFGQPQQYIHVGFASLAVGTTTAACELRSLVATRTPVLKNKTRLRNEKCVFGISQRTIHFSKRQMLLRSRGSLLHGGDPGRRAAHGGEVLDPALRQA